MKTNTQTFAKKWVGIVQVHSNGTKARLTSVDTLKDGKTKLFPNQSTTLDVLIADLPKAVQRFIKPDMPKERAKRFRVRLNEDADSVESVGPVNGVFALKAVSLGPKQQDGTYKLWHRVYNEGTEKENAHDEFFCAYEFADGPFKGMEAPAYWLHYKFMEIPEGEPDEGFTKFNCADTPQATQFHRLVAWAEVHGNILDEDIRWPDDGIILETIEERVLDADITVNGIFENGYIKSVQSIVDYEDDEVTDEEIDDAFPAVEQEDEVVEVPAKGKKKDLVKDTVKVSDKTVKGKAAPTSKKVASPSAKKVGTKAVPASEPDDLDDDDDL